MPLSLLARQTVWAVRRLSRSPGFVAVAVLTLAVAIAPSLIFRLVDQAVLPPLPFPRSQDLLSMWQRALLVGAASVLVAVLLTQGVLAAIALASLAAPLPLYRASRADPLATRRCE